MRRLLALHACTPDAVAWNYPELTTQRLRERIRCEMAAWQHWSADGTTELSPKWELFSGEPETYTLKFRDECDASGV
jgi:hypothetical protein